MVKFIQLSDLHIHGTDKEENVNCKIIVEFIIKRYSGYSTGKKPVVLLTGDIVDDGKEDQYHNAVEILKPLVKNQFKVLACPGNHDYGPYGNFYTEKSQAYFQEYILNKLLKAPKAGQEGVKMEDFYPMVDTIDDVMFIGIDSVVGNENAFLHFASGEVGDRQRKKLAGILQENEMLEDNKKRVVVYFHHHPFFRDVGLEMDDAKEVLRLLTNQVDFLCFGHKHKAETWAAEKDIDWILASGKTTIRNTQYKFQFMEIVIEGVNNNVATVTFKL